MNPENTFGTPEYVVKHGKRRLRKKKRVSAILLSPVQVRKPEEAYRSALYLVQWNEIKKKHRSRRFNSRGQTSLEAFLGISPHHEQPWSGARRVPHTGNWY